MKPVRQPDKTPASGIVAIHLDVLAKLPAKKSDEKNLPSPNFSQMKPVDGLEATGDDTNTGSGTNNTHGSGHGDTELRS
jgi:hypothetical protein